MTVTLILTHENADFDAVASQVAAAKLDLDSVPILSRRLNRNVQNFLTLYGASFPLVRADEWQRQQVDQVIVVDSQAVTPVKGMRPTVPVHFIDHHPLAKALESYQHYSGEPLGANTTLFVEQLRDSQLTLTVSEATLLMLGIYEDTGSLLYGTTTPRDLLAAAWLREQGADLDVMQKFLEHPLSEDQQALYMRLIEGTQTYELEGYVVLVATASFEHIVDEVSSLAHKLREAYDAHAIILLVAMGDHIQLIARSTVDGIDVGQIATIFGGGGHSRAAAAQIRDTSLEAVQKRLIALLPTVVQPAVRVEDLMSRRVQSIGADETVEVAATRMQQSGHEGYPVIKACKVIGLLTRRAVDRAMRHGLAHSEVAQVMESGAIGVHAADSMDTLQRLMLDTGWGQVPVLDSQDRLIGIVTRTDLIKHWGSKPLADTRATEIAQQMRDTLPSGLVTLLEAIATEAQSHELGLYAVGGFVRDLLLDKPNTDVDLVVEGEAITLAAVLKERYGGEVLSHTQFGTAKWTLGEAVAAALHVQPADLPAFVDLVTARREFYEEPAALPTVEQGSIKLDLHRRDFTINTLAIRLAPAPFGKLLDYYGGERDLQNGMIRVLHSLSFIDDATRLLRAVRFEQRFAFAIEPNTADLIPSALPFIARVSGHRLCHEIDLIFAEAAPEKALQRLDTFEVLYTIYEGLAFDEWLTSAFANARTQINYPLWTPEKIALPLVYWSLFTLRLPESEALIERLQLSSDLAVLLRQSQQIYRLLPALDTDLRPSEVVRRLKGFSTVVLAAAWIVAPSQKIREAIATYVSQWKGIRPSLTGNDLMAMGLREGPGVGKLLLALHQALLDGEISTPDQERLYAERWLKHQL
ncbi:MAG: CBS domain-containing protein [Chloroflexota bacterium]